MYKESDKPDFLEVLSKIKKNNLDINDKNLNEIVNSQGKPYKFIASLANAFKQSPQDLEVLLESKQLVNYIRTNFTDLLQASILNVFDRSYDIEYEKDSIVWTLDIEYEKDSIVCTLLALYLSKAEIGSEFPIMSAFQNKSTFLNLLEKKWKISPEDNLKAPGIMPFNFIYEAFQLVDKAPVNINLRFYISTVLVSLIKKIDSKEISRQQIVTVEQAAQQALLTLKAVSPAIYFLVSEQKSNTLIKLLPVELQKELFKFMESEDIVKIKLGQFINNQLKQLEKSGDNESKKYHELVLIKEKLEKTKTPELLGDLERVCKNHISTGIIGFFQGVLQSPQSEKDFEVFKTNLFKEKLIDAKTLLIKK